MKCNAGRCVCVRLTHETAHPGPHVVESLGDRPPEHSPAESSNPGKQHPRLAEGTGHVHLTLLGRQRARTRKSIPNSELLTMLLHLVTPCAVPYLRYSL